MTVTDAITTPMSLDSAMVGRVIATRDTEIDFRSSALYAAAIGAERDIYLDDRSPGGAMAPPAFITSLEWPLVSGPEFLQAVGIARADLFPRLLHMFQDSAFSKPIRVGDRLRLEATLESVGKTSNGALTITRIKTVEARSGRPVAESWFGGYFRATDVPSPRMSSVAPAISVPWRHEPFDRDVVSISRGASHVYGECARLRNPIHTDLSFATALGLPDVALHGTLLWAKMGEIAVDRYLGGRPEHLLRLAARFKRPILPNRSIAIETQLAEHRTGQVSLRVRDEDNGHVISEGLAEFDNGT